MFGHQTPGSGSGSALTKMLDPNADPHNTPSKKYRICYLLEGGAKCQKLLLVEDMPSFALSKPTEFIAVLEMYARTHVKHPLGTPVMRTKIPHRAIKKILNFV
jgi:hypothetical protein